MEKEVVTVGTPTVFNIQKFSVHDGNGIRTSVFFKGCPLCCQWCHNPESQRFQKELMIYYDRCTGCGSCVVHCPQGANSIEDGKMIIDRSKCTSCGICTDWCFNNAREMAGKEYAVDKLVKELDEDQMFYETSGGGVTLSGGEVMVQDMDYIEQLCRMLYERGISVNIDTCGYAPYENFQRILPYVDTFLYDIKLMDPEEHKRFIGVDNELILENLKKLSADGARINIRIPTIGGVNATEEFMNEVINFLLDNEISVVQVNLLPYHDTGMHKYRKLDRPYDPDDLFGVPDPDQIEEFMNMFKEHGFTNVKKGG